MNLNFLFYLRNTFRFFLPKEEIYLGLYNFSERCHQFKVFPSLSIGKSNSWEILTLYFFPLHAEMEKCVAKLGEDEEYVRTKRDKQRGPKEMKESRSNKKKARQSIYFGIQIQLENNMEFL